MKYSAAVITAILGFAVAQDISIIPECAQSCITDAISSATNCGATDYACVCKNQNALIGAATPCVIKECGADVATGKVLPATQEFCDEVANGGGSSGGSSSAEPTAEPTETAAPTETAEPTASATESGSGSGYQTTAAPTTTAGGYPTSGSNSTAPQPTSSAVIAGAAQVGSMGGLAMLFLGAAAAL